ncbi:MAG: oligosaccharide flippase family protein [Candidatus Dormibacteria bacterium]
MNLGELRRRLWAEPALRHNLVFFGGSLLTGFFGYVYQFLAGRLLGPAPYAVVAAVFSLYYLLTVPSLVLLLVTTREAARLSADGRSAEMRSLFRRLTIATTLLGLGGALVLLLLAPLFAAFLHVQWPALLVMVPAAPLVLLVSVNRGILQGEQRFLSLSTYMMLEAGVRTVGLVLMVLLGFGPPGALLAVALGLAFSYGLSFLSMGNVLRGPCTAHSLLPMLRFGVPALALVAGVTFFFNVDIILAKHFFSAQQAGIYGSVATLGRIVYFLTLSITGVMFPRVTALVAAGRPAHRLFELSALAMAGLAAVTVAGFWLLPGLALVPFGAQFREGARFLPIYGLAMTFLSLNNLLANYLLARHDHRFVPVLVGTGVVEVGLIWVFHADLGQVMASVLGAMVLCFAALGGVYVSGRASRVEA